MSPTTIDRTAPAIPRAREVVRAIELGSATVTPGEEELGIVMLNGCWFGQIATVASSVLLFSGTQVIDVPSTTRPVSVPSYVNVVYHDAPLVPDAGADDFVPPLVAAGRLRAVAVRGTLPPVEWDD